ncbi:hydrolase [Bradyrhizobium sp. CB1650]|uniref:alpha/beta hydrolase family protein n=1 Tax=Bradyrhizobium sp. CB1650 TaxID=3039153 RepID=UPI002435D399|nr:hydrolase [Bradyrhizobium sp. CB1650]WGD54085.1 hydrolase [Bradyrhizobium sp. CB1650]
MSYRTLCACVAVLGCLASTARAAGIQLLNSDPALSGAIWYPCAGEPAHISLGNLDVGADFGLTGVKDCPVTGTKLPLVVFSHGRGGWFGQHHDTVEALADAGFVVAAINHPGDSFGNSAQRDDLSVFASRPVDIVRLLDFVLHDWKDRAVIDPARIGFFGFSKGGYTGLILIGGAPDFARLAEFCQDKTGACAELHGGAAGPHPPHDARIRAAVIVDPSTGVLFTRDTLAAINIPLQYWRSERGGPGVGDGSGTARMAEILPSEREFHAVPAGHFAFLAPCSSELAAAIPRICTDNPADFDRAAFHRDFNANVTRFFREHLAPAP